MKDNDLTVQYFPEDHRSFCSGPLGVRIERFGGVECISLLDVLEFEGKSYPERYATSIFTNRGTVLNRPFMAAAVYFEKHCEDGTLFRYAPEYPVFGPNTLKSRYYDMILHRDSMAFRLKNKENGLFSTLIGRSHYECEIGKLQSKKNQLAAYEKSWLPYELRGKNYDPDSPFPEDGVFIGRKEPVFDPEKRTLCFEIGLKFKTHFKKLFTVMTCNSKWDFEAKKTYWMLNAENSGEDVVIGFGFGETFQQAEKRSRRMVRHEKEYLAEASAPDRFPNCAEITVQGIPGASLFSDLYPAYQRESVITEDERECTIRASQTGYGFFSMWDHIFPIRDFLIMNEPGLAAKALRYIITYPHLETGILCSMQTVPAAWEYYAFTGDSGLLREMMGYFIRFFRFALKFSHPRTGLLKNTLACAVDVPGEFGCKDLFYDSGLNGWWYDFCRSLQNMALLFEDTPLAEETGRIADKILKSFLNTFYSEKEGFLLTAVPSGKTKKFLPVFAYTGTMGLEYAHGEELLRPVIRRLAEFQKSSLRHPLGHTALPVDSEIPCISWKAVHMNQHLGHECRCARLGGEAEEAFHLMNGYMKVFSFYRNAVETFNYCFCLGNQGQNGDWQTFSATGAMQGLLRGLAGLDWHCGGLRFVPARDNHQLSVRSFGFRGSIYDFSCSGQGAHVGKMTVNGHEISGTLQLPMDITEHPGRKVWSVVRSDAAPGKPLLLNAPDLMISSVRSTVKQLVFTIRSNAYSALEFYCPSNPEIRLNGTPVPCEEFNGNIYRISGVFRLNDKIIVKPVSYNRSSIKTRRKQ